jgi:hypothetical protein
MQKLVGLGIDDRNLHGGGTYVHADPQIILQIAHSGRKDRKIGVELIGKRERKMPKFAKKEIKPFFY